MKYPDTHRCAATHCTRQCDRKYLMCRNHWARPGATLDLRPFEK